MTYGHLQADCLYTGISSGPNARYRVWEAFTFFYLLCRAAIKNVAPFTYTLCAVECVQIQFFITLSHTLYSIYIECEFPRWGQYLLSGYMLIMLTLFTNFYIHAYIIKRRRDQRHVGQGDAHSIDLASGDYTNGLIGDNFGLTIDKKTT